MNENDFFNALIAVGATIAAALNIGIIAMEWLRILTAEDVDFYGGEPNYSGMVAITFIIFACVAFIVAVAFIMINENERYKYYK